MTELRTSTDLVPSARKEGEAVVVAVRGEIDLHNSPEVRTELLDLLAKNAPRKLILNLGEVPYMDSSAIAVLVEAMRKLRAVDGKVYLTNLHGWDRSSSSVRTRQRRSRSRDSSALLS